MYSVLIQNKKTIESFKNYHSLFMEALNENHIGVCRWIESGTTVKTALPELLDLIEDKEEWRAVIVRFEDEDVMGEYESSPMNPYDFRYYHENDVPYGESCVPLVRLTHMLSSIPAPKIHYTMVEEKEPGKAVKVIYKPEKSIDEEREFINLLKKYDYDGPRPSEILLVTIRNKGVNPEKTDIADVWQTRNEIESSSFWETNHYANLCRFMVYDVENHGNFRREADYFRFWLSVLLLATNPIESAELQAYRLYKINLYLDKTLLQDCMQEFTNTLLGAQVYLKQILEEEEKRLLMEQHVIPEYSLRVPVTFETPGLVEMEIPVKEFPLTSNGPGSDFRIWNNIVREKEEIVNRSVQKTMISLEDSADRMRDLCTFDDKKIKELNKFQKKQMKGELFNFFTMILSLQKVLPSKTESLNESIKNAEEEVKSNLKARASAGQIMGNLGWICLAALLCIVPGLIILSAGEARNPEGAFSAWLLLVDIIVIPLAVLILLQRLKLRENIERFNEELTKYASTIADNTNIYEEFLSAIASHSRGSSYLNILKHKKFAANNLRVEVKKHLEETDSMMQIIEKWSRALHVKTDFKLNYYEEIEPDVYVQPKKNRLYTPEYGQSYTIPLNNSGCTLQSPYVFIKKLELSREELYEYHEE